MMDTQFFFLYIPLFLVLYIFTTQFFNKIRNFPPSPTVKLPIIGHLHLLKEPLHRSLAKASENYGPVLLLQFGSRHILHVSSPSAAEECLGKNDIIFANRPRLLTGKHFGYNYTSLVWSPYGDHWRNLRKISSTEVLSQHRLQALSGIRAKEVRSMIFRLLGLSGEGKSPVDVKTVFLETFMNAMMRMMAGKTYFGEEVEEVEEVKRFRSIVSDTLQHRGSWYIGDLFPVSQLVGVGGSEKKLEKLQTRMDSFFQELVQEQKERMRSNGGSEGKKETMIQMLLALQEKEPEYYTDHMIKSLMLNLLEAGVDTSAATCEWALSLLLNHPQVMKKAKMEIEKHVGHGRLIDESDVSNIPYLRAIINEAMRMYPIGPLLFPHESTEPCTIGGYRVPAKTILLVNAWAIQNDPQHWEDPKKFEPERFQGVEAKHKNRYKLMPFGSGRRSCPGEGLALCMLGLVLGSVIQCFEWERIGNNLVDMNEDPGGMTKAQPLVAYCKASPLLENLLS